MFGIYLVEIKKDCILFRHAKVAIGLVLEYDAIHSLETGDFEISVLIALDAHTNICRDRKQTIN